MPVRTFSSGKPTDNKFIDQALFYYNSRNEALENMLEAIWGQEGASTGQSLFRTMEGERLKESAIRAYDKPTLGITEKKAMGHMAVASFFEKNPTGNLLIMMKDDNEPHILSFNQEKHEYSISEEAFAPKPLPEKPGFFDRFLGFFGNKKAKEKITTYDNAVKDREWYEDLKETGKKISEATAKNQAEKAKREADKQKELERETAKQKKLEQEAAKKQKKLEEEAAKKQKKLEQEAAKKKEVAQKKENPAPAKEAQVQQVKKPFETDNPLLQEAYSNLKQEMAEKPNLAKISLDIHMNTKKGLLKETTKIVGSDPNSIEGVNFAMNVARQLAITTLGDAPEIGKGSSSNTILNNMVGSIYRTKEFQDVLENINSRVKGGDIDYSARRQKIQELIKDGGKNLITDGLRKKFMDSPSLTFAKKAPEKAMAKSKQNDKVLSSSSQKPPVFGGRK